MTFTTERVPAPRDHAVRFYDNDTDLADTVGAFMRDGLGHGEITLVVATERHRRAFARRAAELGIDLDRARDNERLVELDAAETLSQFLVEDSPHPAMFDSVVGGIVGQISEQGRPVRVYGEMVALLWDAGQVTAAMALESLWNTLSADVSFSLLCAYPATSVEQDADALDHLCGLHSTVVGDRPCGLRPAVGPAFQLSRTFGADPHAPRDARRFAVEALSGRCAPRITEAAELIVAELTTNALLHARSGFTLDVSSTGATVRIAVRDDSSLTPMPRDPTFLEASGRGLRLVAAVCARWGSELVDDGKVIWVELET